jgi:hypothetical protein
MEKEDWGNDFDICCGVAIGCGIGVICWLVIIGVVYAIVCGGSNALGWNCAETLLQSL